MSTNFGLQMGDVVTAIGDVRTTVELSPNSVSQATEIVKTNINEFAKNGIIIDPHKYNKMNNEMNKFIRESVGNDALTQDIFMEKCIKPLKKNNIITSENLSQTMKTLSRSTYGYKPDKSIFFYMQLFNALNIILNTPAYYSILKSYNTNGTIVDLETFLNKCAELRIVENEVGSQTNLSYMDFMKKHSRWGITTNARLIQYANKLSGFYTALNDPAESNKKYLGFLNTVNSFHRKNTIKNIYTPKNKLNENNKLYEFIRVLKANGINTYEEYNSIFEHKTEKITLIKSGDITVQLETVDVYNFIPLFTTYYNDYRYPKTVSSTGSTSTPDSQFADKYPAIYKKTIPGISFVQSIGLFLSTFKELQFTTNGCFGHFINSLKNGPKYMINLLDPNQLHPTYKTDPANTPPILYQYYVTQNTRSGIQSFTTMTTTSSQNDSVFGIFQPILDPFIQLFKYTFPTTYKETFNATTGYLDSIRGMGVSDTNSIPISPTKTVNDSDLFAILSESIQNSSGSEKPLSMPEAVDLLRFFGSITLPVTQIDQVLTSIKQFGVTPNLICLYFKFIISDHKNNFQVTLNQFGVSCNLVWVHLKLICIYWKLVSSQHKNKFKVTLKIISSNIKINFGLLKINVYLLKINL
jgi:hypothetical protein